jgi:hypothetical protein
MINQDVADIGGLRELKIVHDASIGHRTAIAESTQQYITRACQDRILRVLWFRTMNDRKESISTAHNKTLHWPLEPPRGEFPWDDLSKWLQFDSGIYWISGKAGSGKSTLMKHIYHQQKTRQLLSQWAGDAQCSLVDFFFWNLGTAEQKSQEELSRALLYQILSNNPSLIADVLPNVWKQLYDTDGDDASLPSAAETRYAFQVLATRSSDIGKFCFFIDGLDEFVGNHLDGIAFIKELAVNTHIKIVASSRPIPDCVTSFHGLPTLQLHHLTRGDITSYVQDIIGGHQYMQGLISRHPEEAIEIMEDAVTKSSGVFLWVILACRSLISGFSDYDRISELRRRVDELPPELEEMFQHMLNRINKRHREQGSRMLRICYATRQAQDTREVGDMSSLGLALMDDDSISTDQISVLTTDQKRRLCDELDGRLRSRCGGLLELELKNGTQHDIRHCFCGAAKENIHDAQIDGKVVFMHRTVFEFLSNEQTWELECLEPPDGFEVATDLSIVGLNSAMLSLPWGEKQATDFLRDGMQWGAQSDRHDQDGERNIFWVMQPFLDSLSPLALSDGGTLDRLSRVNKHNLSPASSHATLILAIEACAANYAKQHPEFTQLAQSTAHACGCLPLLYHSVALPLMDGKVKRWRRLGRGKDEMGFLSNAMANLLLAYGCDPNYVIHDEEGEITTPWATWLHSTHRIMLDDTDQLEVAEVAFTFLSYGADLLEDLREWVVKEFKRRRSDPVRKTGNALLQFIEELKQETGICSVSGVNVQTNANKDDHNTSRMPMGSPRCSGVHARSCLQMKRKTAHSMFPDGERQTNLYVESVNELPKVRSPSLLYGSKLSPQSRKQLNAI